MTCICSLVRLVSRCLLETQPKVNQVCLQLGPENFRFFGPGSGFCLSLVERNEPFYGRYMLSVFYSARGLFQVALWTPILACIEITINILIPWKFFLPNIHVAVAHPRMARQGEVIPLVGNMDA